MKLVITVDEVEGQDYPVDTDRIESAVEGALDDQGFDCGPIIVDSVPS